ncbi:MAG: cadmium resistance transporter [Phycisphaerales bacterium]
MIQTLLVGAGLFASTNVDDIFLTMAFFSDARLDRRSVVLGKFAGIGALTLVSTAAAACTLAVPPEWVALLGSVPLALGIKALWDLRAGGGDGGGDGIERAAPSMMSQVLSVAGVTAANGGDNIGVYVPVFAKDLSAVPAYVAVFAVMTVAWCIGGYVLVSHRLVARTMRRVMRPLLPVVLIVLGLWILSGARGLVMPAAADVDPPATAPAPGAPGTAP